MSIHKKTTIRCYPPSIPDVLLRPRRDQLLIIALLECVECRLIESRRSEQAFKLAEILVLIAGWREEDRTRAGAGPGLLKPW